MEEVKRQEPKVDHSPPFNTEVKNEWSCIRGLPSMPSWLAQVQLLVLFR